MQFGIFTVGDVTTDPTTGRTPTEHERTKSMVTIARKAEVQLLVILSKPSRGGKVTGGR
jgi:hypothetical protein